MADYAAWLVEMNEPQGPVYFQLSHDDDWTKDHNKALHFSRQQDAERAIEYYGWTEARPTEHCWPVIRALGQPPQTKKARPDHEGRGEG